MPPFPIPTICAVAVLGQADQQWSNLHDRASRDMLLTRIAGLLDVAPGTDCASDDVADFEILFVPRDSIERRVAEQAGIHRAEQILVGVVPATFVATKAITYGLLHADARHPPSWSHGMADRMGDAALTGYTAFGREDALAAGLVLLATGVGYASRTFAPRPGWAKPWSTMRRRWPRYCRMSMTMHLRGAAS